MDYTVSNRMSTLRGSAIREIFKYAADPAVISLAGGNPNPELFPSEALSEIAAEILREQPVTALQYGITEGYTPLREAIRARLFRVENIGTENDDVIVTSGGQQGIELATKCLVNEGDTVIVELPSFIGATNAFRSYGAHLVGVPVKEDGMDLDALEKALAENSNVRFIYTIPTFQNPMGVTMSVEKRRALYEIARKNNILILEDNPYGELTFDGVKIPLPKECEITQGENGREQGSFYMTVDIFLEGIKEPIARLPIYETHIENKDKSGDYRLYEYAVKDYTLGEGDRPE